MTPATNEDGEERQRLLNITHQTLRKQWCFYTHSHPQGAPGHITQKALPCAFKLIIPSTSLFCPSSTLYVCVQASYKDYAIFVSVTRCNSTFAACITYNDQEQYDVVIFRDKSYRSYFHNTSVKILDGQAICGNFYLPKTMMMHDNSFLYSMYTSS